MIIINRFKILPIFITFLITLTVLTCPGFASSKISGSKWSVPFLGNVDQPEGFEAVDLEVWMKSSIELVDKQLKDANSKTAKPVNPLLAEKDKAKQFSLPDYIKLYQLQLNDGKYYHTAWAAIINGEQYKFPGYSGFFQSSFSKSQQEQLKAINDQLQATIEFSQNLFPAKNGFTLEILDLKPLERMRNTNEIIYSMSGRVISKVNGLALPLSAKAYFFERNGQPVIFVLVSTDADGKFWNDTGNTLLKSLKKN